MVEQKRPRMEQGGKVLQMRIVVLVITGVETMTMILEINVLHYEEETKFKKSLYRLPSAPRHPKPKPLKNGPVIFIIQNGMEVDCGKEASGNRPVKRKSVKSRSKIQKTIKRIAEAK